MTDTSMSALLNKRGEKRASIGFYEENNTPKLKELWFMWSLCNLECTHCYVGSSPRNNTLEVMVLDEIKPYIQEARSYNIEDFYFTGGEPFANKELPSMIEECVNTANVTILTNGLGPIEKYFSFLRDINKNATNKLTLRISLDSYIEEDHDKIRGKGSFRKTVSNTNELLDLGVKTIITTTPIVFEESMATMDEAYDNLKKLFNNRNVEIKIIPFTIQMGSELERKPYHYPEVFISEKQLQESDPFDFQCYFGRTIQKINGKTLVYPCPIIYNDRSFELGTTIRESISQLYLSHKNCYWFCFKNRGKCGNA